MKSIIGYLSAAMLIVLGLLFAWAGSYAHASTRVPIGLFMVAAGIAIVYMVQRRTPREVVQRVEVSGSMAAQQIQCPNCSAMLDLSSMEVVAGIPTVTCPYCGNRFEITEEPKW
jgi:DNA-directed RNA polymerase subunit RPC12/RpoP